MTMRIKDQIEQIANRIEGALPPSGTIDNISADLVPGLRYEVANLRDVAKQLEAVKEALQVEIATLKAAFDLHLKLSALHQHKDREGLQPPLST